MSVERVGEKDQKEINVEYHYRGQSKADITHLDDGMLAVMPDDSTHGVEYERVNGPKDEIANTEAIIIVLLTEVMAVGVGIDHIDRPK